MGRHASLFSLYFSQVYFFVRVESLGAKIQGDFALRTAKSSELKKNPAYK